MTSLSWKNSRERKSTFGFVSLLRVRCMLVYPRSTMMVYSSNSGASTLIPLSVGIKEAG